VQLDENGYAIPHQILCSFIHSRENVYTGKLSPAFGSAPLANYANQSFSKNISVVYKNWYRIYFKYIKMHISH